MGRLLFLPTRLPDTYYQLSDGRLCVALRLSEYRDVRRRGNMIVNKRQQAQTQVGTDHLTSQVTIVWTRYY